MDLDDMEAFLGQVVIHKSIAHAENILAMLRKHEAEGKDHETSIRTIYKEVTA